jgi:adenylate kinase
MSKVEVVVFLGPPGSGKGTQAKKLCESVPGWMHVSTGDLFRAEISSGSPLGLSVKEILSSGKLVTDDVTNDIFASQVEKILGRGGELKGLLLDGYPRTAPQTRFLIQFCHRHGLEAPKAIELKVSEEAVVSRLANRVVNPRTGRVYHRLLNPPKQAGVDDEDGGPLIQRSDDRPEVVRSRYQTYVGQRDGIVQALGTKVQAVDGEGDIAQITTQLLTLIG